MYNFYTKNVVQPPGCTCKILLMMHSVLRRISDADKRKWIMRANLTTFILIMAILQVSANSFAQKITLFQKNAPLVEVFDQISAQTGYDFLFNATTLKDVRPVTIQVKNAELEDVLIKILEGQPLEFSIDNNSVIISRKELSLMEKIIHVFRAIDIHGKIVDEQGEPIPGATVLVKGTGKATVADGKGEFTLNQVDENADIVISSVGYKTLTLKAAKEMNTIKLEASVSALDQVQVIGYGTTTKRLNTGNVSSVKADVIAQQPVTNPLQALAGRVAGLQITQVNGLPGASVSVQIRGRNSIAAGNNPLYIIDGVPFTSTPLELVGGPFSGPTISGFGSPLNTINPNDIESIEILKDADATAIYGSRGSNGVILITTKKGIKGGSSMDVNVNTGFGQVTRYPKTLNTQQYLQFRTDAFTNSGITPTATNAPDLKSFDPNADFDWQKWFMGNTTNNQDANMTFKSGNEQTNFLLSGTYHKENTVRSKDDRYERGSFHLNGNHISLDKKFQLHADVFYSADYSKMQNNSIGVISAATAFPNYPIYTATGSFNWPSGTHDNYMASATAYYKGNTNNLLANAVLNYTVIPALNLKVNIGYNRIGINQLNAIPSTFFNPSFNILGLSLFSNQYNQRIISEPLITYNKNIAKGKLELLAGGTLQNEMTRGQVLNLNNYSNNNQLESINYGTLSSKSDNIIDYKYVSVFSRLTYNWDNKYILNGTFRRDGSSRFGPGKQFGNFGSVAGAWLFNNESFIKDNLSWLSYGKLRGSYGTTGNDGIPDYGYLSLYTTSTLYGTGNTLLPSQIANADYSWEVNKKLEVALELGVLKDRILLNTAWYRNRSGNQLVGYFLPSITGFTSYQANLPALVQNTGWEFELNTINIQNKGLKWTTSANLTIPKNKLLSFPDLAKSSYANTYIEGQSLNIIQGFHFMGVDPANGLAVVQDINGDKNFTRTSSYNNQGGDYIIIGNTDPKWFGGLNNSLTYKTFQLDIFLQYTRQQGYNLYKNSAGFGQANIWQDLAGYWKQPGSITAMPKPFAGTNATLQNFRFSDATVSDASFMRLKNISLSHNISNALRKMGVKNLRVYLQGQNLLTFTKYKGYDPELATNATINIPPLKVLTAGLQVSL